MSMTNCQKGTHAELLFCAEAGAREFNVLVPVGHSSTVDVWIHKPPGRPISVQVKRAYVVESKRPWTNESLCRYGVSMARGNVERTPYQSGDFDVLAAYLPDKNDFVLWRFDEIKDRKKISYTPRLHRQPGNWQLLEELVAA